MEYNYKIHNEKTGYYIRSPDMGLARDRLVRSTLRQRKTQFSRRRQIYHPPSDIGMGPSVCRQEDGLIWKRKFSHQASGHQAPEPQDVQSDARVGLKTVLEDNVRDSGKKFEENSDRR